MLIGAEFLAMILVIVYVGAVAVLFLFVVMMLDINFAELRQGFLRYLPIGALIGLVLLARAAARCWACWAGIRRRWPSLGKAASPALGDRPTRAPSAACSIPSTSTCSRRRA